MRSIHACPALQVSDIYFMMNHFTIQLLEICIGVFMAGFATRYFKVASTLAAIRVAITLIWVMDEYMLTNSVEYGNKGMFQSSFKWMLIW